MTPKQLLTVYDLAHREHNDGIPAPIIGSKDGPLASKLIKRGYSDEQLESWVNLFFVVPDSFIRRTGYTFGVFFATIGVVIQFDRRTQARRAKPVAQPTEADRQIRASVNERRRQTALDFADDYYRERPWLTRPPTLNDTPR